MRMTSRKKEILSYFEPDSLDWVTGEIGAPPFDVSGVAYLLHGMVSFDKRHQLESTRRTLESMVDNGLLERVTVYESRQVKRGGETSATVVRYGLPGQCAVVRDSGGADNAISGEYMRVS
ncbi:MULTISPECIES: hypothetical protein [Enterobacteriaceae]|uniref:hypothetical protein n=1 Tax=Enterobacteriaceae TaxID=543 RepID=UPI00075E3B48|nr:MULTISPECIES: hypothetical protein [Enterobacteriaceae]EFO9332959.1 hypothetical protein [Escherichia coli]SAG31759.1 Uncharacterised protein [Enterobacter cloacae]HBX5351506.1 hypothetical protein [Klebsiella pneumoniae]HCB1433625.1 hypothetical protein [Citrobacter braakii]EGK2987087.1 hypothetical protein [Escherichia coli]